LAFNFFGQLELVLAPVRQVEVCAAARTPAAAKMLHKLRGHDTNARELAPEIDDLHRDVENRRGVGIEGIDPWAGRDRLNKVDVEALAFEIGDQRHILLTEEKELKVVRLKHDACHC